MARQIESVAVLGCGTMGSGIAALAAAQGCKVLMMDVSADAAEKARERIDTEHHHLIDTGSFVDDLAKLSDYDWICEAVVEDLDIKRDLLAKVDEVRKDGSAVTSNTSGIPLRDLTDGQSDNLVADMAITHFFNPVQVMKLLELVPGDGTNPEVVEALSAFATETLGKGVVRAKDTVNFIANRIGCHLMLSGLHLTKPFLADGMTQETVDAVLGKPVGVPPTGLYGLIDLIGLDVMDLVGKNLAANLPDDDEGRAYTSLPATEQAMLERGQLGRKARDLGGFAKVEKLDDGAKKKLTFDLQSGQWRDAGEPDLERVPADLGEVMFTDTPQGELAWQVFGGTLRYAAALVPEIADDIVSVDNAMRWGFNWALGPFEMIDTVGVDRMIERIQADGDDVPPMLTAAGEAGGFYRGGEGDRPREFLGTDNCWHPVVD